MRLISVVILLFCSSMMFSQIIYVKPNGNGDGSDWTSATTLRLALNQVSPSDQIWIQEGIYYPTSCTVCSDSFKMISFEIPDNVQLYGGFSGSETLLSERDFINNITILSGDIDDDGTLSHNSYSVISVTNVSNATRMDGLTITMGNATDNSTGYGNITNSGGGFYNNGSGATHESSPIIANCIFIDNQVSSEGAAIFNNATNGGYSATQIKNCTFQNNSAIVGGGAIYNKSDNGGNIEISILNCTFTNNQSQGYGGAIVNSTQTNGQGNPIIQNCIFTNNRAQGKGGAIDNIARQGTIFTSILDCEFTDNMGGLGGAVINDGAEGIANGLMKNCNFTANIATGAGAALYNTGESNGISSPTVYNCNFINNHSNGSGGCIFNNAIFGTSNPIYTNCVMAHNIADDYGAGMYSIGKSGQCNPTVTNCLFYDNDAYSAGGMYNLGSNNGDCSPIITNCTFYGNTAIIGGGIYCNAADTTGHSSAKITNCIIWGNTAPTGRVMRNIYGTPVLKHTLIDVDMCSELNSGVGANVTCGVGVIYNENPLFVSTTNQEFHLMAGSPAIDIGDDSVINNLGINIDLDSLNRIFNGQIDLGCYEVNSDIVVAPSIITNPSDLEICEGGDAFFTILAAGTPPLLYQWFKDNTAIPNADSKTLLIQNTDLTDIADYKCVIEGPTGDTDTSSVAQLGVSENLLVTVEIDASTTSVCNGDTVIFTATTMNEGVSPYFEWKVNWQNTQTGNNPIFETSDISAGDTVIISLVSSEACTIYNPATSNTIIMTEGAGAVTPSIQIQADHLNICGNESINCTSTIQNGGTNPTYEWKVNGVLKGSTADITLNNLSDSDVITCALTSNASCVTSTSVMSNELVVQSSATSTSTIAISSDSEALCSGETVEIQSSITNGGTNPTYQWYINENLTSITTSTFSSSNLNDGDIVKCVLHSNDPCATNQMVTSNSIAFSISESVTPTISILSDKTVSCSGEAIIFTAQITNGGATPSYKWYVNGVSQIGNTEAISFTNLVNNSTVFCELTSSSPCVSGIENSNTLIINAYGNVVPDISISPSSTSICQGDSISFTASVLNEGDNPTFIWYKNDVEVPNENDAIYTTNDISNSDIISCTLVSSNPCVTIAEVVSNQVGVQITATVTPQITLIKPNEYCEGNFIQINTIIQNGGTNPQFKWILNNEIQDGSSSKFDISNVSTTDQLYAILTSDIECTTSSIATSEILTFEDAISAFAQIEIENNQILCDKDTVTFTTKVNNEGNNPKYKWYKNGASVGQTSEYTTSNLQNGDEIYCSLTSNAFCIQNPFINSDTLLVDITPSIVSNVTLATNFAKICVGDTLLCIATATNGGSNPEFNWYVNDTLISAQGSVLRLAGLTFDSKIQVLMKSSIDCPEHQIVSSNFRAVEVNKCPDATIDLGALYQVMCSPNPTHDILNISFGKYRGNAKIILYDLLGKQLYTNDVKVIDNASKLLHLEQFSSSIFILVLELEDGVVSRRILKE